MNTKKTSPFLPIQKLSIELLSGALEEAKKEEARGRMIQGFYFPALISLIVLYVLARTSFDPSYAGLITAIYVVILDVLIGLYVYASASINRAQGSIREIVSLTRNYARDPYLTPGAANKLDQAIESVDSGDVQPRHRRDLTAEEGK